MIFNVILASDKTNGIGLSETDRELSLPWKIEGEWKYDQNLS